MIEVPSDDQKQRYAAAVDALNRADWNQAQQLAMPLIREVGSHAGVYFVAGVAARELLQIPLALECLQRAVAINPGRADYMAQLARALAQASEPGKALVAADKAMVLGPKDAMTLDTLAVVYTQAHAYEKAVDAFAKVVEIEPRAARFRFNYATALVHAGDVDGAEREFEACLERDPHYWKAYLSLAQLRRQTQESNHIARLQGLLASVDETPESALFLNVALCKEYEDLADYPRAFQHLTVGKRAARHAHGYSSESDEAMFSLIKQVAPVRVPASAGYQSDEPIFVMGMPRTGTTLIDRIISSHPDVYSAGELQNFGVALKRASGSRTQQMLDMDMLGRSRHLNWAQLGEQYLQSTRPSTAGKPRFVDKLPHNFLFAGFIAAALPKAKLICLRRNPMDTCLSNFRQLFALNSRYYNYSFDLLDTGRYYLMFDDLMRFWRESLGDRLLEIEYEAMVGDQETHTRNLLAFCGLEWNDACMRFEENAAPVATASAVQVRSGMNRDSLYRWKRYGDKLDPLRRLLEEGGIEIRD